MHRDYRRYGSETRRGICSKEFVADLHAQGVPRDDVIVAVSRVFGVPKGAAQLFVLSHPAWVEDEADARTDPWDG